MSRAEDLSKTGSFVNTDGKLSLTTGVTGVLPVANGGTGTSTGVSPGGSNTQVQFNNSGTFGGSANLTFDGTTLTANAMSLTNALPVASGGTGSTTAANARTALGTNDAANITTGILAVARGGTGTATPSLVGGTNITISGTWPNQTVTAAGGGVTSLNGQTGAITNTDLYAIGSYVWGRPANTTNYPVNSTVAGSILNIASGLPRFNTEAGFLLSSTAFVSSVVVNTGTWRCMTPAERQDSGNASSGLWVRIS